MKILIFHPDTNTSTNTTIITITIFTLTTTTDTPTTNNIKMGSAVNFIFTGGNKKLSLLPVHVLNILYTNVYFMIITL